MGSSDSSDGSNSDDRPNMPDTNAMEDSTGSPSNVHNGVPDHTYLEQRAPRYQNPPPHPPPVQKPVFVGRHLLRWLMVRIVAGLSRSSWFHFTGSPSNAGTPLRIVLLGKTGVGKSASGNTILGIKGFVDESSPAPVTRKCEKKKAKVSGREVEVVDTPGLFDTLFTKEQIEKEMEKYVSFTVPGPHVFLLVFRLGVRFTEEDCNTMKWIQETFSKLALKYSMVLFTGEESIDIPVDEYIEKSPELKQLIGECGDRYHIFDNKSRDLTQVTSLLAKIDRMVATNGGQHYTNHMYEETQRIEEEEQRGKERERLKLEWKREWERERKAKLHKAKKKREEEQRKRDKQGKKRPGEDTKRIEEEEQRGRERLKLEWKREWERERKAKLHKAKKKRDEEQRKRDEAMREEWEKQEEKRREEDTKRIEEECRQRLEEEKKRRHVTPVLSSLFGKFLACVG